MAHFFIDRPVFASVISLVLVLAGVIAGFSLPIAQYPEIALPTVRVSASYLGASADVVEEGVTTPLDRQINGVTDMLYIKSTSGNDGTTAINVTFDLDRDPDLAAVEVQNRVSQATGTLPTAVVSTGVTVTKQSQDTLMFVALFSPNGTYDALFMTNYVNIYVADTLKRVTGIGDVRVFGSEFGMRIWLRPDRMASLGVTVSDVAAAVREQNVEAPAGQIGQPPAEGQEFQYAVRVRGRLVDASEFQNIVVRSASDGSFVRIKDFARVELGAQSYNFSTAYNRKPAAVLSLSLAPGANAIEAGRLVRAELQRLSVSFPADLQYSVVFDSTEFVYASLEEVVETLVIAVLLVLVVMFVFLQSWRATLIPLLAVPVSLIATFVAYLALGFTINTLTLFGMVLAIGIIVDDAIVVVEAVERVMEDEGLPPKAATHRAMDLVSGPIVATALVLAAVFVPMAFVPGITGQLYQQFALTIAVSNAFSAIVALTLTPALSALMLRPKSARTGPSLGERFFGPFNRGFEWLVEKYGRAVAFTIRRAAVAMLALAAIFVACWAMFGSLSSGFVPDEDQGAFFLQVQLPEAAALERTQQVVDQVQGIVLQHPAVRSAIGIVGFDLLSGTAAPNTAICVVRLKPWDERRTAALQLTSVMGAAAAGASRLPAAVVIPFQPPALPGIGTVGGFSFMLQARGDADATGLMATAQQLMAAARQQPAIGRVSTMFSASTPGFRLQVDREKAKKLGVPVSDIFTTLQSFLGGAQINDFTRFGRNFKVTMQGESSYRQNIAGLNQLFVRNTSNGGMVPLDTLVTAESMTGPRFLMRYNLYRALEISGAPAPGHSSGEAIAAMEAAARTTLPPDYAYEWSGQSRQEIEAGNRAMVVFGLSILVSFLFLAALYESWAVPFAVLLTVPVGVLGAIALLLARDLDFDVYGQIGLVTLIGLAAKNAILIVEYAKINREQGMALDEAARFAARVRLRPIVMTSLAFILGVLPLAIASGAGAAARISVGTTVIGGMTIATLFGVVLVPVLFIVCQGLAERFSGPPARVGAARPAETAAGGGGS